MKHIDEISFMKDTKSMRRTRRAQSHSPEGIPRPDNQGDSRLCTRFALSKAINSGFIDMKFSDTELDFVQGEVTTALINEHKDDDGKFPTDFDGKSYHFQENVTKIMWSVLLKVIEVEKSRHHDELKRNKDDYEYVLVYKPTSIPHAVYVEKYNTKNQKATCINSLGPKDPNPRVYLKDVEKLYRISCTAKNLKRKRSRFCQT